MTNSLTITDNRTGQQYEVPIADGTIKATDLRQIRTSSDDFGLMTYDPAYQNTAACRSAITFIDGDKGILRYRGYPIEQLAEQASFLDTAYLIFNGELPTADQRARWEADIASHSDVPENLQQMLDGFPADAHPMGAFLTLVGALSTYYPDAKHVEDPANRQLQIQRLIGQVPALGAYAHRHVAGSRVASGDRSLSYSGRFLRLLFQEEGRTFTVEPVLERALDVLFILHADHEQNCSTSAMRNIGSSHADPFSATAGAIAALYGPLHGGANEAVLKMLQEIGSIDHVPDFIRRVKGGEGRLMGFGHRIYKSYDPRARIIKRTADEVFAITGRNPLLNIAQELERIALEDDYFVKRKLYPNVDFYSGLIYQAMGFPVGMFPVLFAIARTVGWLAQWDEMMRDADQKIARPRQIYIGLDRRDVPAGSGTPGLAGAGTAGSR
jgi:citrate synthase